MSPPRRFTASDGSEWVVSFVTPRPGEPGTINEHGPHLRFESGRRTRALLEAERIAPNWEALSDAELERLCEQETQRVFALEVVKGPQVLIEGTIARVVSDSPSGFTAMWVERWDGEQWDSASSAPSMNDVFAAPAATEEQLRAAGVPPEEFPPGYFPTPLLYGYSSLEGEEE
jgi:hypothetical protein